MTIAGWWWWSGRPREAIAAPTVLTAGAPLSGLAPTAGAVGADPPSPADAGEAPVAAPAVASVVVHVVGQVRHPGVVTLPAGSRVGDAVTAVGGVSKKGADDSVNLARVLVDGEQVIVGFGAQVVAGALGLAPSQAATLVNLNSADAAAFEQLPGVGPVLADRIVQWRTSNGPFRSIDELGEVSGIGDAIMGQLRSMVTV
jgi:competence protein ComEA